MYFYRPDFIFYFAVFAVVAYLLRSRDRNAFILLTSYFFYGMWDWRFLLPLIVSTLIDYCVALHLDKTDSPRRRKALLMVSVVGNLGLLGFFKYFDFFAASFQRLGHQVGIDIPLPVLQMVLPAGISFYTFQTLSYTIDVYRRQIPAEPNLIDFATFVTYFPQLLAGPIERAKDLLPQLKGPKHIEWRNVRVGVMLFSWGLFKKVYVADNVGGIADEAFADPTQFSSLALIFGAYAFAFQIYCDFSGYTDMALGLARLMGIRLTQNFNYPYFSTSIQDFWRRWHITLSRWFRDYVYIPLGGNRRGLWTTIRNLLLTFTLSGLWHGAGWNYIIWGSYFGAMLCLEYLLRHRWGAWIRLTPSLIRMVFTFHLVVLGWILFRSPSITAFRQYLGSIWAGLDLGPILAGWTQKDFGSLGSYLVGLVPADASRFGILLVMFVGPLLLAEVFLANGRMRTYIKLLPVPAKAALAAGLLSMITLLGVSDAKVFIYFQF